MATEENIKIELKESGKTVVLRKYLTTGQSRQLQRLLLSEGSFDSDKKRFDNIPPQVYLDMQDKALEFLVVEIEDGKGGSESFTKETIDELPIKDGNRIYDAVNKLMEESSLSEDDEKKS